MENKKIHLRFGIICGIILIAAMSRLIPPPANFAPIGGVTTRLMYQASQDKIVSVMDFGIHVLLYKVISLLLPMSCLKQWKNAAEQRRPLISI